MFQRDAGLTLCLCVTLVVSYTSASTTATNNPTTTLAPTTTVPPPPTTVPPTTTAPTTPAGGSSQETGSQGSSDSNSNTTPAPTSTPSPTSAVNNAGGAPSTSGDTNTTPTTAVQSETTAAPTSPPTTTQTTTTTTTPTTTVNYCITSPCLHNGTCVSGADNYTCACVGNWTGPTCNEDVHNCDSSPCHNGGNCTDTGDNTYTCSCTPEWLGSSCDININDQCVTIPCGQYGYCQNRYSNYTCLCDDGTEGRSCSKPNLCNNITCGANEECKQVDKTATCGCKEGYHFRSAGKCEEILLFSATKAVGNYSNHGPYLAEGGFPYYGKMYTVFYVNRDGYITLDRKWDLPNPITDNMMWPKDVTMVAPLWWQWEVPDSGASFHIDTHLRYRANSDVGTLDEIGKAINRSFVPQFALIATWMYVIPKPASQFAGFQNATFQCTLTTDGKDSYAVIAYRDLNVPSSLPLVSGYSNVSSVFHPTTHDSWNRYVYPLFDASEVKMKNDNYECLKSLSEIPRPDREYSLNNTCPCLVDQARVDRRFKFTEGDYCAVQHFGTAPAQCCYDRTNGNLLRSTKSAGYPRYKNTTVATMVQRTHDVCCGNDSTQCKVFYRKVLSDTCTSYTKLLTMRLWGNPVSGDNPPFIFNGIGEYVLAGDNFQFIQARFEKFKPNITRLTAFVVRRSGETIEAVMDGTSVNFYQDGDPISDGKKTEYFTLVGHTLTFRDGFSVELGVHQQLLLSVYYTDSMKELFDQGLISVMKEGSINISKIESVKLTNESDSKFNYSLTDVGNFTTLSKLTMTPPFYANYSEYMAALFAQPPGDITAANTTCGEDVACLLAYSVQPNQSALLNEKRSLSLEPDALALSLPVFTTIRMSWQIVLSKTDEYRRLIVPAPGVNISMQASNAVATYNSTTGDFSVNRTTITSNTSFTFTQDGNGIKRSDSPALIVCSCPDSSQCDLSIPISQERLSTAKYFEAVCECPPGFAGADCTKAVNACSTCYPGGDCNVTDNSCSCPAGMEGDGITCYEVNECLGSPCGENAVCEDRDGYYNCSCFSGYQNISNHCVDIDECTSRDHQCAGFVDEFRQYCRNTPGSCEVSCQPKFSGTDCTDKLEYVYGGVISFAEIPGKKQTWTGNLVDKNSVDFKSLASKVSTVIKNVLEKKFTTATLMVEVTRFTRGMPRQRRAADTSDNIAASYVAFMNKPASSEALQAALNEGFDPATCPQNTSCQLGSSGDVLFGVNMLESSLSDIVNPCASDDDNNCHKASTVCVHGNGTFSCQCRSGFTEWFKQDNVCKDIDECVDKIAACGDTALDCVNEPGSYSCVCQSGYAWTDKKCLLTDHCRSGPCLNKASCVNTPGEEPGFACKCPYGYTGATCKDKDAEVEKNKTIIIAVSASLGGLCFLLLVALCCVCARKKKSDKTGRQAHYRLDEEEDLPALRTRIPRPQIRREPDVEMERQESFNKQTKFDKNPNPESHQYVNLAYNGTAGEENARL